MRITIDIPPDVEKKLLEKCNAAGVSPSEFINALVEWYFLRRDRKPAVSVNEFVSNAMNIAKERGVKCKYSDGSYCALETLGDLFEDRKPEPLNPYKCLFCVDYVDRSRKKEIELEDSRVKMKMHEIAMLAARYVFELYGDKLGYQPEVYKIVEEEKKKEISKEDVKKLLDNW
ncbi:hypothetical protein Asulf_01898 [Archaeoglobus sulfaticallidus PM70-1]|uniref:Uncharacterized protein n=1 Tax=Archaeoglobus sulfaticallidus PM70-1 TaxID=387631 RepID=N0BE10_9EURY|nr:hypothetical protein [Archaeoglobus sulfaticallidus]AGK61864.1 hypothetical protein Asulf_01898 [Archaeoglobus sulfaticallidus PM70-1]